jgi:hypothetical protein
MRPERAGKVSYASPTWEALIKPLIDRAEAERRKRAPGPRSEIAIDRWTKPKPGWLYVLDPVSEPEALGSRVWLVDPETSKVMGNVRAVTSRILLLHGTGSTFILLPGNGNRGN